MVNDDAEQMWLWRHLEDGDAEEAWLESEERWEATGVPPGVPNAQAHSPATKESGIEPVLRLLQAEPLKRVARRYAPATHATRKAELLAAIGATLAWPERLDQLVASLSPLERTVLEELARRGGTADGWQLITFAVLQGQQLPDELPRRGPYGRDLDHSAAARWLGGMIADGLLIPYDTEASWFYFARGGWPSDLVQADQRLLDRLTPGKAPAPAPLPLATTNDVALEARHPAGVMLELLDLLRLVGAEGGLQVTRRGTIAKPFLKRLQKARPYAAFRLEALLRALPAMGLVDPPDNDDARRPWTVDAATTEGLHRLPLYLAYAAYVDASCAVRDPVIDHAWRDDPEGTLHAEPFWRAVLDAVAVLPEHATSVDEAASHLWRQVLEPVFGRVPWAGGVARPVGGPPEAVRRMLQGPLPALALLATGTADDEDADTIAPATGARWYLRARARVRRHAAPDPGVRPGPEAAPPGSPPPEEPSLLVQPNFEVLAYLDRLSTDALAALACAQVERIDAHTANLRIDRSSVDLALARGDDVDAMLDRLRAQAHVVPDNVAASVRGWAARRERWQVHLGARLLEYASEAERDAALPELAGARPLAERFVLLSEGAPVPPVQRQHAYRDPPERTLTLESDGAVYVRGSVDLTGRAALHALTTPDRRGRRRVDAEAVRTTAEMERWASVLQERSDSGIPPELHALLRAWSGASERPTVATATLFRHPDAPSWAARPELRPLLGAALNPSTYLVRPGKEGDLRDALDTLGVTFSSELDLPANAQVGAEEGALQTGLSTRKKRELIEAALEAGHDLELAYVEEREHYGRYGYVRRSKGKRRSEVVTPEGLAYAGSSPYLVATTKKRGTERVIRIGYIDAIAVRSEGVS